MSLEGHTFPTKKSYQKVLSRLRNMWHPLSCVQEKMAPSDSVSKQQWSLCLQLLGKRRGAESRLVCPDSSSLRPSVHLEKNVLQHCEPLDLWDSSPHQTSLTSDVHNQRQQQDILLCVNIKDLIGVLHAIHVFYIFVVYLQYIDLFFLVCSPDFWLVLTWVKVMTDTLLNAFKSSLCL